MIIFKIYFRNKIHDKEKIQTNNFVLFILGVGRAFGVVCAYYYFVLNVPLPKVSYELSAIRPAGYFDRAFLENAIETYKAAFE